MRVLHLIKTPVGATWAVRQIRALGELGVDIHVAIPPGPRADDLQSAGAEVHPMQTNIAVLNPLAVARRMRGLRSLVDTVRPDIVHSHFVGTTVAMRLALRRNRDIPRVFQVPGPLHLESGPFRVAELAIANSEDYWIASCEWTRDRYLRSGIDPGRVSLSYYGANLSDYPTQRTGDLRKELMISENVPLVGMVAYMYPPKRYLGQTTGLKGHEDLIEAVAIMVERGRELKLAFVGGAWNGATAYEKKVRDLARTRLGNRVVFLGTRNDVSTIYPDFDVAVHPSHSENVGGALESLLAGVPTIATNVGGFPDVVIDRTTGLLVPPRDPRAIAAAIAHLLDNQDAAREMAKVGIAHTRRLFDLDRTAREVLDSYESIRRS